MASLFQHLRVLLWKNWLGIKRQPVWSLTLIAWPVFLFILMAIIRTRFPPEAQPNCYLAPRNLPSAGFFPFLQTVLCSSDARCKSTPYTPEDLLPKLNGVSPINRKWRRSANPEKDSHPSSQSADVPKSENGSLGLIDSTVHLRSIAENISSSASHARINLLNKILSLGEMQMHKSSAGNLKAGICEVMATDASSQNLLWEIFGTNIYQTFCFTNLSLVESFFQEFRSQIPKLQQDSQYQVAFVKETVSFLSLISQVQNETSLWRILLMAPDITQGVSAMKDMIAALQNTSRIIMAVEKDSPLVASDNGLQAIQNMISGLLQALNCSKQDNNSSAMNDICQLSLYWKNNPSLMTQMKDIVRKILPPDFAGEDFKMRNLSKDLETIKKSLHLFEVLPEKFSTAELNNLFKQYENNRRVNLTDILQWQMEADRDSKLRGALNRREINQINNFTSLLLQNDFNRLHLFDVMAHLKESQNVPKFRNIWKQTFLNKTKIMATKIWQTIKTINSHKLFYMPENLRRYLASVRDVPSLISDFLFKPATINNFPEKFLTLQKILNTIGNVHKSHNYLVLSFIIDKMQDIQNFVGESHWNEFNHYWRITEKLRSAKLSDTDIVAYGQVLDILHNNLHVHHNGSGLPLKKELGQLTKFVNHLMKEYSEETNVSMFLDAALKTLDVLEDLEERYTHELIPVNPLKDASNETVQRLFQIFKEGKDILSDPRLTESSSIKKLDTLFSFSRKLLLQKLYRTSAQHDSLGEGRVQDLLYLTLTPFLREDNQGSGRLQNCTVKDVHHIVLKVLLNNATLLDALRGSSCHFLFASTDLENKTAHQHTFTELFQLAIRNLKMMPTFQTLHKDQWKYFSDEFQCFINSLQVSSEFLYKLNYFQSYKNLWIQKMHRSLTAISNEFHQSNLTCRAPWLMDIINGPSALHILSPFILNETEPRAQNLSGSVPQALAFFILLQNEPYKNDTVSKMLKVSKNDASQSKWKNLSKVLSEVAKMLSSNQNVTNANQYFRLLDMTRKALLLVGTGLAPNKTETHLPLETLSWQMKASYLEDVLGSLKLFLSETSNIDFKAHLERLFNNSSPPVDVLAQSLFYMNPHWKETKKALNLSRMIWNQLFLNETSFKLATIWEDIQKVMSMANPLFPEDVQQDFNAAPEAPLQFSDVLLRSKSTKNIWEYFLALLNKYHFTANVSMRHNAPLMAYLSGIMQKIQNTTNLYSQDNGSDTLFSVELEELSRHLSHLTQKYAEEDSPSSNISEVINVVLRNLFLQKAFEHQFNTSQLDANPQLVYDGNKGLQRVYDILRQGTIMLSDSRLEEETAKGKIAAVYRFSHFIFQKEFNEFLLELSTLAEAKIIDALHLSLSLFLDIGNHRAGRPHNCSVQDAIHAILQMLFNNATIPESLKQSHCKLPFTSRDFENRTMPNQTFTELFQDSISNLKQTPELARLYKNNSEYLSSALLCIIKSLQFSSSMLSKMDILFNFKHPWIRDIHKTLAIISNELPPNESTCPILVLSDTNNTVNYDPLNLVLFFFANEAEFYTQNLTDSLADWNKLSVKLLQDSLPSNAAINEVLQIAREDVHSQSGWKTFSHIWNMFFKWNITEAEYVKRGLKLVERVLVDNEVPDASVFKNVTFLNLLKELRAGVNPQFLQDRTNLEYQPDHVAHPSVMTTEKLLNRILLQNELVQTLPPSNLIGRFLFSEFENVFLHMSPNNVFRSYLTCVLNVSERLESEFSGNVDLPPSIAQLKRAILTPRDTGKKDLTVPEILMLRLTHLQNLTSLLCDHESIRSLQRTCQLPGVSFAELCDQSEFHKKLLCGIELSDRIVTSFMNHSNVSREFRDIVIGDPKKLQQQINRLLENVPQLKYIRDIPQYMASLNSITNITQNTIHSRKQDMLIDLFRNVDLLKNDLRDMVGMSTESINALMEMPLPENRTQLIFWILQLESCDTNAAGAELGVVAKQFCNLPLTERVHKSYVLGVTLLHYLDVYSFMYKVLFPMELQTSLDKVLALLKDLDHIKEQVVSDVRPLLDAIHSLKKLRQSRNVPLSKALSQASNLTMNRGTFKIISKALCNEDVTPLFFESLLPDFEEQNVHHSSVQDERMQHIMNTYGIPQNATSFCTSIFLDLVKTPTGALIWSFLKPMLFGRILYTPDTPETRAIMEKSNATLKLMAELTQKSQEWLDNLPLLMSSLNMLKENIPIAKNALQNPFVQVFIKLMVKLDTNDLLNQIDELDDIRWELQNNADIINELSILAGLSVNVSSCVLFDRIRPFKTVEELEMVAKDFFLKNELLASIIFKPFSDRKREETEIPGSLSLPPLVNYTIRMSSKISQTTRRIREKIWTVGPHNSASQSQIYSRAFVYIQDSIDRAIIELQTGKTAEEIAVQVQATPYPCYNKDMFLTSVTYSLPFMLMAAWILYIAAFVKKLVEEKDLRLYEYMKMMGVNSSSHFIAWFIECATFLLITTTFLIVMLKVGNVLSKINVVILFLYLLDYSFSIIAMCYLISVFFNNTNIAALVGCLIYILTFFPFIVLLVVENHVSFSVKSLLSLLSPTAFSYASQYIARYEEQGIGLQWDNMYKSPMSGDETNFGWMCWLILIDSFIYFILGWYIRNVFPGKYGIAAPWYFPLLPSYWAERYGYIPLWSEKRKNFLFTNFFLRKEPAFPEKIFVQGALPSNLEPEPTDLKVGVSLYGITKVYGSKAAVQNLNLNFYEGNITSLLGHNGAGKTTTISILTGLFPASSGTIFVYGKDIRTDQDTIRKNMGICMQHNVLFSYLTTKEHLLLYGYIKVPHWSKQELYEEVERTLKETGLYNHRHKLTGSLSGGMKRKLSISIALLGGSKVVILDEPTTGVDPCSRRGIWEIISKNRKGRTIILSTHHLDEAEVLSDRIAFLEHGGLKCCGSPFYLKETFGSGYHLTLTKRKSPTLNFTEECDTSAVTAMIQSHLPEAYLKEDIGGELVYALPPFNSKVSSSYQSLLRGLDSGLSDLHIGCYGISDSTVEEVFLNLTKDQAKDEQADVELSQEAASCNLETDDLSMNADNFTEKDDQALVKPMKPNSFRLLLRKATALLIKRFHHTRRNVKGFIAQVVLPVLFVTAAMGLGTLRSKVAEYPALHLSPSLYGSSKQTDFFGNYNETTDALVASMLSFPGADSTCVNKSILACFKEGEPGEWVFSGNQSAQYSACNCTDNRQKCPKVNFSPPHKRTFFSRTIYNLTGHDVETYLLVTAKDFVQKRYGGWSFGLPLTNDLKFDITPVPANRTITKVWYNPEGYHSLPAYLNSLNNFILRANLPKENSSEYGISVVAHPYPGGESQEQAMLSSLLDIIVSMSVLIGYSITTASFVLYVVKEHQTKAKQLQHISGMGVTSYWVTNFIYDLVYFLIPVTLSVGVISAFRIPAFFNDSNLLAVFLLLLLFGYATFPWMYLLAGMFKETGMAFIVYVCINLFFGINTIMTHSIMFLLSQEKATDQSLHDLAETLRHIYLIFPQFCFGYGLIELSQYQALMGFLKAYGVDYPDRTFELDRISSKLLGLFIQGTILFSIRLLVDDGTIQKVWYNTLEFMYNKVHGKPQFRLEAIDEEEDKDVQAERERVALGIADCDMLQLQNLTKIYHLPHRRIVAVKNVSIGIPAGECFGLLGVNGAGKTTIFKMLTGDIEPSFGRLLVRDETGSLNDVDDAHWSLFGYCPQEDALDDLLTVEEHMYYYARLHGIPEKHIKGIVLRLLYRLNLMSYQHRITSMCSYGTNRKLSTALALLGKPSILLLDEPSSGMDPNAKRHLWKIITEEVQNQCSVILTSHSMEECEALCTRLAIMVNGCFRCLGSLQHIKSRFGKGFTVKMHLNNNSDSIEKLTEFLQLTFPNTHLKDHQLNMVEYHVPVSAGGVANIFQMLEANKEVFKIRHFSVSQTTLEEVFINFAKDQGGPDVSDASSDITSDSSDLSSQDSNVTALY
ncbi:glucosylceramide transporter ABCA12 [Zootoca vivipara]|uniref:glucosylceramide transporter ABCA12 n=1 Tax=Zootoca vivipara TaxID=8524 RepID=UPI00159051BD|nr:glucosylceramide transporter ABCA12 [Zootoca vivipara]